MTMDTVYDTKVHLAVTRAVLAGKLSKPDTCSLCGNTRKLVGHHDNYEKPLDVRWVCHECHKRVHREIGHAIPGKTKKVGWRIPESVIHQVKIHSAISGESMEEIVSRAILEQIRRETKKAEKAA